MKIEDEPHRFAKTETVKKEHGLSPYLAARQVLITGLAALLRSTTQPRGSLAVCVPQGCPDGYPRIISVYLEDGSAG